uniref:Uncharacterized protein n=1 Tax=viral metagenome TaxID=1070528 RepID=A0A6C0F7H4_9ZZZZ|tara:strand:+ start:15368 stop:15724 length:357 start_codon:yes stop_codon:yes gene_type:complete
MSLYFLSRRNNIFSTRHESRTWLIGLVRKHKACSLAKEIMKNDNKGIIISNIDYTNGDLAESLVLNRLGLIVADDFATFDDDKIIYSGYTVNYEDYIDINIYNAQKKHLEGLYDDNCF